MKLLACLLPFLSLLLAEFVPPTLVEKSQPVEKNAFSNGLAVEKTAQAIVQSTLIPDVGFYQIPFGAANEEVPVKFVFTNKVVQVLTLVDAFWSGDQFKMTDFGYEIGSLSDACLSNAGVPVYRDDPYGAWKQPGLYCVITAILLPGTHSISIVPTRSPQNGGSAFLRLDTGCSGGCNGIAPCCDLNVDGKVCNIKIFHGYEY